MLLCDIVAAPLSKRRYMNIHCAVFYLGTNDNVILFFLI
jgi:hypothetical protein